MPRLLKLSRRDTLAWLGRATGMVVASAALSEFGQNESYSAAAEVAPGYGRDPPLLKREIIRGGIGREPDLAL